MKKEMGPSNTRLFQHHSRMRKCFEWRWIGCLLGGQIIGAVNGPMQNAVGNRKKEGDYGKSHFGQNYWLIGNGRWDCTHGGNAPAKWSRTLKKEDRCHFHTEKGKSQLAEKGKISE
jgi:hypothetical protein